MPDIQEISGEISMFLSGLRHSVDRPFRAVNLRDEVDRADYVALILIIEEARVLFNSYVRFRAIPSDEQIIEIKRNLIGFVDHFIAVAGRRSKLLDHPYHALTSSKTRDNINSIMIPLFDGSVSIGDSLLFFKEIIERTSTGERPASVVTLAELERIIPNQQVAPAKFEVVNGKIKLVVEKPDISGSDVNNINSALEYIKDSGNKLLENLERSNCDRRLIENLRELQSQIEINGNIVKIGLTNLACGVICGQSQHELPDAINAMLNAHTASVSMYVAQFPEWEKFTERASAIELDDEDVADIDVATANIIEEIERHPDLADPSVPKTIKFIQEFLRKPGKSTKRIAFAAIRTIENLIVSIINYTVSIIRDTASKTAERVSTAAANVITGLLGIALIAATGIGPAAMQAGAPWVKQAAEVVQRQVELLPRG